MLPVSSGGKAQHDQGLSQEDPQPPVAPHPPSIMAPPALPHRLHTEQSLNVNLPCDSVKILQS